MLLSPHLSSIHSICVFYTKLLGAFEPLTMMYCFHTFTYFVLWIFFLKCFFFPFVSWMTPVCPYGYLREPFHYHPWSIPSHDSWTVYSLDHLCCWGQDLSFHSFIFLCLLPWLALGSGLVNIYKINEDWGGFSGVPFKTVLVKSSNKYFFILGLVSCVCKYYWVREKLSLWSMSLKVVFLSWLEWLCWASSCKPKGRGFDSWSRHMPRMQVPSLFGVPTKGHQSMFLSYIDVFFPPPSLSFPLSLPAPPPTK